jgi:sulfate/thiosulfate-binding protein
MRTGRMEQVGAGLIGIVAASCLLAVVQGCGRGDTEAGAPAAAVTPASDKASARGGKVTLTLGAYTTPREAYGKAIIPAFQKLWKEKTGQEVEFKESYQASGGQARAIISGFEADVAALSLEGDIDKITEAGLITHDWKTRPHGGMVSTSVVVLAVRKGNPKRVRDWTDLAKPGLEVLTPDPKTSGGAMWNINAMYGAALRGFAGVPQNDSAAAQAFLASVFRNVSIMDKGARESITNYERGVGDVAVTYENEVLVGRQAGKDYEYVVPRSTILIENPAAVVDKYVDQHGVREVAEAFVDFLWTAEAQRAFAQYGLRPVDPAVAGEVRSQFPPVEDLWKIDYLGGWKKVADEIYGPRGRFTLAFEQVNRSR